MSKPKGRRRPLQSEITSLRQPAELAEAESAVPVEEPTPVSEAPETTPLVSDIAPAPVELRSEQAEAPAAEDDVQSVDAPVEEPAPGEAATVDPEGASLDAENGTAPFEAEASEAETEFDGPSNVITIESADPDDMEGFLSGLIEALLFTSQKPLELKEIARSAGIDRPRARELLERLTQQYANRGINIDEVAGGYVLRSSPRYAPQIQKFLSLRPVRLSRAQLETLAIVAYRQPVTKPEVDEIRGVDSGQVIKGLLERSLLKIVGKKDEPGRPSLYGTTNDFLELLNLKSLGELPTLREYTELSEESRRKFAEETGEEAPDELPAEEPAAEAAAGVAAEAEGPMSGEEPAASVTEASDPGEPPASAADGSSEAMSSTEEAASAARDDDESEDDDDDDESDEDESDDDESEDDDDDESDEDESDDDESEDDESEDDEDEDDDK